MLLAILSIIALLFIGWYFVSHKLVADAGERVMQAWTTLDQAHRQREDLARQVLENNLADTQMAHKLKQAWQRAMEVNVNPDEADVRSLRLHADRQTILDHALRECVQQHEGEASAQSASVNLAEQYPFINQQIREAVGHYNQEAGNYNDRLRSFPINLLSFTEKASYPI